MKKVRFPAFDDTIEYMNENYPFMATYVLKLGKPMDISGMPMGHFVGLAYVTWDEDSVLLHVNMENLAKLPLEQRVFVLSHETFHVMLNHNKLPFDDKMKANVAADIVINDYLVHCGLTKVDGLLYGEDVIGFNSMGYTVKEVFDMLPEPPEQAQAQKGSGAEQGGSGNEGGGSSDPQDKKKDGEKSIPDFLNGEGACGNDHTDHGNVAPPKEITDAAPPEIQAAGEEFGQAGGKLAGNGATDVAKWLQQQQVELAWADILEYIHPSIFKGKDHGKRRMSFNANNRKVAWMAPKIILPIYRDTTKLGPDDGKKASIVLAIDTSYSISEQTYERFFRIAQSIPLKKIELRTIGFTSVVLEFDLAAPQYRRGGTSFQCIEDWIQKEYKEGYPDGVIVFTDGEADFYNIPKQMDRWHWFLCDGGGLDTQYAAPSATVDMLERFVR